MIVCWVVRMVDWWWAGPLTRRFVTQTTTPQIPLVRFVINIIICFRSIIIIIIIYYIIFFTINNIVIVVVNVVVVGIMDSKERLLFVGRPQMYLAVRWVFKCKGRAERRGVKRRRRRRRKRR